MKYFGRFSIPDITKNSSVLMVIVFTELFAIVISLLIYQDDFLKTLGFSSVYLNWVVLLSLVLLRLSSRWLNRKTGFVTVLGAVLCCYLPFVLTEIVSQYIQHKFSFAVFDSERLFTFSLVALIVIGVVLRLFSVMTLMEERNKSEMSMKVHALQSRIKPHFLFNSLNTISELVATEPNHAEQAINSLAMLFRAGLENEQRFYSLSREIVLCERYLELEHWRLEDRLSVDWNIEIEKPDSVQVPKLIIQPLLENAVVYGVQKDGTVNISVDIKESKQYVSIMIENSKGDRESITNGGNGIAIDNIRERLFVLFDDQQSFRVRETNEQYRVLMRFSKKFVNDVT